MNTPLVLNGLIAAPSQVCGALRLVPLIRARACADVRLEKRELNSVAQVQLEDDTSYWSFVPHGLVLRTSEQATEAVTGGQLRKLDGKKAASWRSSRVMERMVRRVDKAALRFLPLHLALEGFLGLHFGGPNTTWPDYSSTALSVGLGFRAEFVTPGLSLYGFENALRTFEIHHSQVGVLIFVADQLAAASVFPSPADYRLLHTSLLEDFYGELIQRYAALYARVGDLETAPDISEVKTLSDLRNAFEHYQNQWHDFTNQIMLSDILGRSTSRKTVYRMHDLHLERFINDIDLDGQNHIGEVLTRADGEVLYLKTFLLSSDQARKARLLEFLAANDWHLERTAMAMNKTQDELIFEFERLGFGYLLKPHVIESAHLRRMRLLES
jgi:hypothetical protein